MSQQPISLSPDLQQLRADGYDITINAGYLVLHDVPYVNQRREVHRGSLVAKLDVNGDITRQPDDHVAYFSDIPCETNSTPLPHIIGTSRQTFGDDLVVNCMFSSKPPSGCYANYHEKMTTYVANIEHHAHAIDPSVTAKTFAVRPSGEESVFNYEDSASSRANIVAIANKLRSQTIAIIGMGGTGAYILDLVAKTPVRAIHVYDGDRFGQHNAFRTPGAPSITTLQNILMKAEYFRAIYAPMHKYITAHPSYIDATNINELRAMSFVFIAIDRNNARKRIVDYLEAASIPFVDVGMGIPRSEDALGGILRVTTSTPEHHGHLAKYVPLADNDVENEYERNIQVADLNTLNAALAVIKWKKLAGFYQDTRHEHHATFTIRANMLVNDEDA
jgi:uncharacterized protein DUF6791/ThiF family protein